MPDIGIFSRYFTIGLVLSLVLAALAWGIRQAPEAARREFDRQLQDRQMREWAYRAAAGAEQDPIIHVSGLSPCEPFYSTLPPREQFSPPVFPGCGGEADYKRGVQCGYRRLFSFLAENVRQPEGSGRERVLVEVTIGTDGKLIVPQVRKGADGRNPREALRVINLLVERDVRWTPGSVKGETQDMSLDIPVFFHGAGCGE